MNVGFLIGIYMAVCVSMLVFNLAYIFMDHRRELGRDPKREIALIRNQLELIGWGDVLSDDMHRKLRKKLSSVRGLEKFNYAVGILREEQPDLAAQYLLCCQNDFQYLSGVYLHKNEMEQAFFARVMENSYIEDNTEYNVIKRNLVEMTKSASVYCRENSLRALYRMGDIEAVRRAYETMSRGEIVHYGKLLTDGLLNFRGNLRELAGDLWEHREEFSDEYVLAVMRFIRMSQDGFEAAFLELLKDEERDREIRLEAIRYFRKYYYEPAYPALLSIVRKREEIDWEYVAVAALSLGNYPGKETISVLKAALSSANWYIRYNAADMLAGHFRVSYLDISDVYNGRDRYAREILSYMMERYDLKGENGYD